MASVGEPQSMATDKITMITITKSMGNIQVIKRGPPKLYIFASIASNP